MPMGEYAHGSLSGACEFIPTHQLYFRVAPERTSQIPLPKGLCTHDILLLDVCSVTGTQDTTSVPYSGCFVVTGGWLGCTQGRRKWFVCVTTSRLVFSDNALAQSVVLPYLKPLLLLKSPNTSAVLREAVSRYKRMIVSSE